MKIDFSLLIGVKSNWLYHHRFFSDRDQINFKLVWSFGVMIRFEPSMANNNGLKVPTQRAQSHSLTNRDGSNLYLIWSAWFDLKIYLVPSFAWFGLIWRFKYLGLIWLEQYENCKCLTWLGLVFKYLKKAWAWSFDFLKGLIWLEKYKPESNLQPRIIITEKLWIFYFCILLDVILRLICYFNTSFFN